MLFTLSCPRIGELFLSTALPLPGSVLELIRGIKGIASCSFDEEKTAYAITFNSTEAPFREALVTLSYRVADFFASLRCLTATVGDPDASTAKRWMEALEELKRFCIIESQDNTVRITPLTTPAEAQYEVCTLLLDYDFWLRPEGDHFTLCWPDA